MCISRVQLQETENHSSYFKQKGIEYSEAGVYNVVGKAGGAGVGFASTSAIP